MSLGFYLAAFRKDRHRLADAVARVNAFSLFGHPSPIGGDVVAIVVQITLLTGLWTRQPAAWYAARLLAGFGIAGGAVGLVVASVASNTTFTIATSLAAAFALSVVLFYLLGRGDSRLYFLGRTNA